jgi:hypothetical protein
MPKPPDSKNAKSVNPKKFKTKKMPKRKNLKPKIHEFKKLTDSTEKNKPYSKKPQRKNPG